MFGKKKDQALFNAVDDSRTVVHDFRLRATQAGFESYRTVEYRLYHKLEEDEMMPRLEEHLSKLFAGEVDDGNGDMLDAILFGAAREALPDLGRQHYDHSDTIRRLIIRRKADREDIRRIKEEREAECEAMRIDYEKTCKMLDRECKEV
ncbi:MAG: hypothetical protein NC235_05450 [Clostridiales bacterium]|nr:hypothetical protein [Clostridiales bacterium]